MNFNNFKGGLSNLKSIYQVGTGETTEISNFDIELGGLKLRAGTKKRFGPFESKIQSIQTAIDTMGNEFIFVDVGDKVKVIINNCLFGIDIPSYNNTKVIFNTNGFKLRTGEILRYPKAFYGRKRSEITLTAGNSVFFFLNSIDTDYYTDDNFPENLKGKAIIDRTTNNLYIGIGSAAVNKGNIAALLPTNNFQLVGKIGTAVTISPLATFTTLGDLTGIDPSKLNFYSANDSSLFTYDTVTDKDSKEALRCKHIIWHPSSMRYFAAGHPENKRALYVSNPNELTKFSNVNILYPHLNSGEITSLSIVEKSVLVGYEHGWSHYIGSDPTTDAQWSLLSVPDGCRLGQTVQTTPNSVTFFSDSGLVLFSTSILTVQSIFAPSSLLYKYISKNEINIEGNVKASFYYSGKYYLATDKKLYIYNFELGAFNVYDGLNIDCMTGGLRGEILMADGNYILEFDSSLYTDFDVETASNKPISFSVAFPVTNICHENEVGRIEHVCFKGQGIDEAADAVLTVESEFKKCELDLKNDKNLSYKKSDWDKLYYKSALSESFFSVDLWGNVFFVSLNGATDAENPQTFFVNNIFISAKKERNKIC